MFVVQWNPVLSTPILELNLIPQGSEYFWRDGVLAQRSGLFRRSVGSGFYVWSLIPLCPN